MKSAKWQLSHELYIRTSELLSASDCYANMHCNLYKTDRTYSVLQTVHYIHSASISHIQQVCQEKQGLNTTAGFARIFFLLLLFYFKIQFTNFSVKKQLETTRTRMTGFSVQLNNVIKVEIIYSWHEQYRTFPSSNLQVILANSSMVHALA